MIETPLCSIFLRRSFMLERGRRRLHLRHNTRGVCPMATPKPIPEGMHTVTPSLKIRDAAKAIEFYKEAFGATERGRFDSPGGGVMHAEILIGDSVVML